MRCIREGRPNSARLPPPCKVAALFCRKICMARHQVDMTPIETRDDLVAWFEAGSKPRPQFRIGTEHEEVVLRVEGLQPVSYQDRRGLRALLEGLQHPPAWE